MKAARYTGDQTIEVVDSQIVPPGDGQVRLEVAFTGICGTDLHIYHGAMDRRVQTPAIIGHEMSGRIADIGPGVTGWNVGDPVTVMPLDWCGHCPACVAGHSHICHALDFIGIDSPGSMQSSWTVDERTLVRLPAEMALDLAALAEPTAVAVHDVRRAGIQSGERVLVVGGGPVGMLVAMVARSEGADVAVIEINAYRRSMAASAGLRVIDPATDDVTTLIAAWTGDAGVDAAFEVSGAQVGLDTALASVRVRGRLVVVAIHTTPRPLDLFRVFWRELSIHGARVYERIDFLRAVELLDTGTIPARMLITHVVPITEAPEAFQTLDAGGDVLKVFIDCSRVGV